MALHPFHEDHLYNSISLQCSYFDLFIVIFFTVLTKWKQSLTQDGSRFLHVSLHKILFVEVLWPPPLFLVSGVFWCLGVKFHCFSQPDCISYHFGFKTRNTGWADKLLRFKACHSCAQFSFRPCTVLEGHKFLNFSSYAPYRNLIKLVMVVCE